MSKPDVAVSTDPQCRDSRVHVTWSLTDWTPGTTAHLQYRRGTGENWQEAAVVDHGRQSYEATFPLAEGPGLLWKVGVGGEGVPGTATSPRIVYFPPEARQFHTGYPAMPAYQYRVVADVPGGSRATGAQPVPLGLDLIASAQFNVIIGQGGKYTVTAATDPAPRSPCVQVRSVVARPFAREKLAGTFPLAAAGQGGGLQATWQSEAPLTRIELAVQYGVNEDVIPIDLTGQP